ncbi:hypothetical protein CR513_02327, partial [Mucuna pruriens]
MDKIGGLLSDSFEFRWEVKSNRVIRPKDRKNGLGQNLSRVREKEYKEPWDYYSNYPVTLPLRRPYSRNPATAGGQNVNVNSKPPGGSKDVEKPCKLNELPPGFMGKMLLPEEARELDKEVKQIIKEKEEVVYNKDFEKYKTPPHQKEKNSVTAGELRDREMDLRYVVAPLKCPGRNDVPALLPKPAQFLAFGPFRHSPKLRR